MLKLTGCKMTHNQHICCNCLEVSALLDKKVHSDILKSVPGNLTALTIDAPSPRRNPPLWAHFLTCPVNHRNKSACSCSQEFSLPEHVSRQAYFASFARIMTAKKCLSVFGHVYVYRELGLVSRGADDLLLKLSVYHVERKSKPMFYCHIGSVLHCRAPQVHVLCYTPQSLRKNITI